MEEIFQAVEKLLKTGVKPKYKADLPGESQTTLADIRRAKSLGWSPKTSLKEGLLKSVEYMRENVLIRAKA